MPAINSPIKKDKDSSSSSMSDNNIEDAEQSALRENIARKGTNSYYYAHGTKIDGPVWDGKEEPKLLAVSETVVEPRKQLFHQFESYSWSDGKKKVSIYIDFDNADQIDDEKIQLESTDSSLHFKVLADKHFALQINPTHREFTSVTYKKKTDKFVLSIVKTEEDSSWTQLMRS